MYVTITKGKKKWFIVVMGDNGEPFLTGQKYYSKWNAKRAAKRAASLNEIALK